MSSGIQDTFKLVVYVPVDYTEAVKSAIMAAGGGEQGDYDQCCWQVLGKGQFRPLVGSSPFIGHESKQKQMVEYVEEYRIEVLCNEEHLEKIVTALKIAHPYEEPAFDVFRRYAV